MKGTERTLRLGSGFEVRFLSFVAKDHSLVFKHCKVVVLRCCSRHNLSLTMNILVTQLTRHSNSTWHQVLPPSRTAQKL